MEITKIKIGNSIYDIKDNAAVTAQEVTEAINLALYGTTTAPSNVVNVTSQNIATIAGAAGISGSGVGDGDTKNTAGATNSADTKLFLVGAAEQSANPRTYTNANCYIGSDNNLYTNGSQVVTTQNISTAITNAGITTGGASTYAQLSYATSHINGSGALTIAGTDPVYVVTVSANISSVALQTNPTYGHSCHIIFKSADSSSYTVVIGNDNTNRICPTSAGVTLTVPAAGTGYVEVDFLNMGDSTIGDEVYVRGV